MIPKIIHYCWFGGDPLPPLAIKCISSWRKNLSEYKIIEWNEKNFDINKFLFVSEAFKNKKFAFVSDVCRLYVLKMYGGIYMDTDVEVLRPLDKFLEKTAFSGFENDNFVPTGIMASEKEGEWVTDLLKYYNGRSFVKENGQLDTVSNTYVITQMMKKKGFLMDNTFQEIEGYVSFYSSDYFCPKSYKTGRIDLTKNSYCVHHFAKSWIPWRKKWKNILKIKVMNILGPKRVQGIINIFKR